jgi:hypothetical protein
VTAATLPSLQTTGAAASLSLTPRHHGLDPVVDAELPRRMDCRIKHALGAAEGRTRVSGNDDR